MTTRVIDKDVTVFFLNSKGEEYGEDRFMIRAKPGESIENLVEERAKKSRYAGPDGTYSLRIHMNEMGAAVA